MIVDRQLPYSVVRGHPAKLSIVVYDDDGVTEIDIEDASVDMRERGTVRFSGSVTEGTVTVDGNRATFDFTGTEDNEPLSNGWDLLWNLTIDGQSEFVRKPLRIVFVPIRPGLTVARLTRELEAAGCFFTNHLGDKVQVAWEELLRDLENNGHTVERIVDDHLLFDPHLALTMYKVFKDADHSLNDRAWAGKAKEARERYEGLLHGRSFRYDHDRDGHAGHGEASSATPTQYWAGANPYPRRRW